MSTVRLTAVKNKSSARSVPETCLQFVVNAAKIRNIFEFSNFTSSVDEMEIFVVYALSYESTGERILKIGPHFSESFTNINGIVFFIGAACTCRPKIFYLPTVNKE